MRLGGNELVLGYEETIISRNLSIQIPDGKISVLIGRNGSGKSTILRALARLLPPRSGDVLLDGRAMATLPSKEIARKLAILPQSPTAPEGLTVEELVWYGRHPYRTLFANKQGEDQDAVEWALTVTGLKDLSHRVVDNLSGGQRQRAWIALALAQGTDILLLDEPTTYLDLAYQLEVLDLLSQLNTEQGKTVVMVLHDLNQAAEYGDHLFVVHHGEILVQGSPRDVMTCALLKEVFGVEACILAHPVTGHPLCIPASCRALQRAASIPAQSRTAR
jgi:ABC-type cobalamin/Fe3+-siderophores transport system ATPase subunit